MPTNVKEFNEYRAKMNQKICWYTVAGFEKGAIIKRLIFYQQI